MKLATENSGVSNSSIFTRRVVLMSGFVLLLLVIGCSFLIHAYVIQQAEKDITTMLLQHKGVHQYVQRFAHPEMKNLKSKHQIPASLYSPVLFSSSYMVRNMHDMYNEERKKAGLSELYYKMAAENPRNPVNQANERERKLIHEFNSDRSKTHVQEVIEEDGRKYLYVATPFLTNDERCMLCHGKRSEAPKELQRQYKGDGGFNEEVGRIRAIESLKAPLEGDWTVPVIAMVSTSLFGLLILGLGLINYQLKHAVQSRTQQLDIQSKELRENERQLRSTLNSIGDGVIVTDKNQRITRMNPEAERLTAISEIDARGQLVDDVFRASDLEFVNGGTDDKTASPRKMHMPSHELSRARLTSASGDTWIVSCHKSPLLGDDAKEEGEVFVFRDITTHLELEERLHQSEKMDALGQLAGGIAHDFNNMLSGILGAAELINDELPSHSDTKTYLNLIMRSADRAAELTQGLLTFARRTSLHFAPLDIHLIIEETKRILERTIDKRIQISLHLNAEHQMIVGNATLLENALLNLGINAGKAMKDGGTLTLSTRNASIYSHKKDDPDTDLNSCIEIRVEDTGVGIPEENLSRIFEPFFTTRAEGEGTGLGLSATYGTIKSHSGDIRVESTVGKGSCFIILLPITDEAHCASSHKSVAAKGEGTILVVDDESIVRDMTKALLHSLGYNVITASNGHKALSVYKENREFIDLVLLDMIMPEMNGADCFREIRKVNPTAKVIAGSGYSEDDVIHKLKSEGLAGYISKPFRRADLARKIKCVLQT